MHILIPVLHRPEQPTGVCRHGANLAQCLAGQEEITQVTIIIGRWQRNYFVSSFNLSSPKIKVIDVDIQNSSRVRNTWFLFGLPNLANRLRPDIVHLSFPFPFIRRWFKAPVVATIHDLYPFEFPENFGYPQVWFNQWFLRLCIAQSDGLSCVSKTTLEVLKRFFPNAGDHKPLAVIYNSVNFKALSAVRPACLADTVSAGYLMFVAQHRKNKNLNLLVEAYAHLCQQQALPKVTHLILVGSSGPETGNLITLIQNLGLQEQVFLLSGLEDRELRWLYDNCGVFVVPSSTEGFCLPLVEAQTLGCRVVCSDIPILREVGTSDCHYFNLVNSPVESLSSAIITALQYDKPAKGCVNPAFLEATVAQQYLTLYRSVSS